MAVLAAAVVVVTSEPLVVVALQNKGHGDG